MRVYLENREIGTTNRRGHLLVPNLRPYEGNQLRVAPYYRSGTVANFGIEAGASAIVRVIAEDGRPIGEGARAHVDNGSLRFPVGLDGRLYLQEIGIGSRVEVAADGELCALELSVMPTEALASLGDVVCRTVAASTRRPPEARSR